MADQQLTSNAITDNPIVKCLDNFYALFTSVCADRKLPDTPDALAQLDQDDLRKLIAAFLRVVQNHPAADLLPAKTSRGTLRSDLLRLELRLSDNDFDLDRVKPLLKRALTNDVADSII
ncbi:serine/threonine-protein kinase Sgk2 [Cordyceps fumosorosea ARSEF 2679]|uniref:Serine/threonine-protein kinase Sgk2 n=1 Tax=Cordyceps fumosorosea (strain ARSEF 2679) TaxID=1081104 RepID=A0A168EUP9_CORFA|nr:serine/threonine-protein kinase Sgk2 [Cordyceps fumosorosea ARSEF 2679]OAA74250.1 serine/threonine-protein kinase Sgk2 [Cordyceps fumosorosea ARSEF 2679]